MSDSIHMQQKPLSTYTIQLWAYGWTISGPGCAVPCSAMLDLAKMAGKKAVIDCGIAHHLKYTQNRDVVMCAGIAHELKLWREEITTSLANNPPQERWWHGVDVGTSSAAIFAVLCDKCWQWEAKEFCRESAPRDAGDFGRCKRLIEAIPEWRERLAEVAEAYPKTAWPRIVARWAELEAATPEQVGAILDAAQKGTP